jgi:hypothetical protein
MFKENQKFNRGWLVFILLPLLGLFIFGFVRPSVLQKPFNESPWPAFFLLSFSVLSVFSIVFLFRIQLKTKVDGLGIHYQFSPFHKRSRLIQWGNLNEASIRKYKPIKEYGGWGVRYGMHGKAYTIAGKYGLQLVLKDGKKLMIGTQQPEVLQELLKKYNNCFVS